MRFLFLIIAFLLLSPAALIADETDTLSSEPLPQKEYVSIALPGQTAYNGVGLTFGMGFGVFAPAHDCDCMGSWQVQMEYFYLDWLSAGGNVRFFGGDLDSDVMVMYQRYNVNVRVHKAFNSLDLYVGPILGFENTSFSEFRKQVSHKSSVKKTHWWKKSGLAQLDSSETDELCESAFSLSGFSVGASLGTGYNVSRLFGLTLGSQIEYNFRKDVLVSVVPGVAFNLRGVWPWATRTLRSTWVSFEVGGQKYLNRKVNNWSNTFFLGIVLGA